MNTPPISNPDLSPANAGQEFRLSWRIVVAALVGVMFGVNGFSYAAFGVITGPLAQAFGQPVSAISFWVTFLFLGNVTAAPLVGWMADRFGARRVVLTALPLFILTWVVAGSIGIHLWMLYLLAVFVGCIGTGAGPITYGRVVNTWFDSGRGTALGIMSAGIGLSYLFGPRLMQGIVDAHGWRISFYCIAAAHLIPLPLMAFWLHERRETVVRTSRPIETGYTVREVLKMPVFWYASVAFILYGLCAGGVTVNLVPFLTAGGLSRESAAWYMGLLGIFSMTGRIVTGYIIDRKSVGLVCAVILVMEAAAFAAFGVFGPKVVVVAISVTGFAFGGEVSCMGYAIARYFGVRHFGAINGLLSVVTGIGVGLGPPFVSFVHEASGGYRLPFLIASGLAVGSAIFFTILSVYPYYQRPEGDAPVVPPPTGGH